MQLGLLENIQINKSPKTVKFIHVNKNFNNITEMKHYIICTNMN